jgi:hypothetical protein
MVKTPGSNFQYLRSNPANSSPQFLYIFVERVRFGHFLDLCTGGLSEGAVTDFSAPFGRPYNISLSGLATRSGTRETLIGDFLPYLSELEKSAWRGHSRA